ncbi:MAG TPA: hypothetical protein VGY53_06520 [Isosphaeraceae bacterium]|jgi:hypothetical protein|nr:hypothetical protein [Isosphaeraceae bacterium]
MVIHGIIQSGHLQENPPGSDSIEMVLKVQGVGPGQPRTLVVPFMLLVENESLNPDTVGGRAFEAEVNEETGRWIVARIALAQKRVLREPE